MALAGAVALGQAAGRSDAADGKPNIVLILSDNVGYGEIACYSNGRMVATPRIDALAAEGLRLTNFNVEAWCSPSRSALLTGRFGVRSGTDQVTPLTEGSGQLSFGNAGMVQWEVTLAELLSARGYATALYGKWHLGYRDGRYPNDQGFDEWYGIQDSWNSGVVTSTPDYIPSLATTPFVLQGVKGQKTEQREVFDAEVGKQIDRTLTDKSIAYIERNAQAKRPFFLLVSTAAVHQPVYCNPEFVNKSGAGLIGDAIMEMDFNVGRIVDAVAQAGISENTIFIFTSDDGPDYRDPWRGTAGPWSGYLNTAMEGSLRVPFVMRWPGHIPAGRVSNEIVHVVDLFPTLATVAGARVPTDRAIDGVEQMDFFAGKQEKSNRESFPVYIFGQLFAVKWRDWKMHYLWQPVPGKPPETSRRRLFHLRSDPKEAEVYTLSISDLSTLGGDVVPAYWQDLWAKEPFGKIVADFQASLVKYPLIPVDTPDPYVPPKK